MAEAGKVTARPGERKFEGELPTGAPLLGPVLRGQDPGPRALGLLRAAPRGGRLPGFLVASMPKEIAYRSIEESKNRLLKWGVPGLLLILALTALVARRALRPILLLSDGAKRVSMGEDVYLPASGNDEIAELTVAFNDMVRKVREGRQRLEEARDQLAQTNEGLRAANRTLETLAITDGLTGLYNHRHFQDTIEKEIRRCDRESRLLSLLLIDIDHFKQYNDRFGHTEGDAALRRVAGQIAAKIRSTDMAFRYGGEEMAVLLPSCGKEQATEVAEKIRVAVSTQHRAQRPLRGEEHGLDRRRDVPRGRPRRPGARGHRRRGALRGQGRGPRPRDPGGRAGADPARGDDRTRQEVRERRLGRYSSERQVDPAARRPRS